MFSSITLPVEHEIVIALGVSSISLPEEHDIVIALGVLSVFKHLFTSPQMNSLPALSRTNRIRIVLVGGWPVAYVLCHTVKVEATQPYRPQGRPPSWDLTFLRGMMGIVGE